MSDEAELAAELYEHRDDPAQWAEEPEQIEVRQSRSDVVSFRMPTEEFEALIEASREASESTSEFIRKAIAIRMHGVAIGPAVEVSTGASRLLVRSHIVTASRTANLAESFVPDLPPLTSAIRSH